LDMVAAYRLFLGRQAHGDGVWGGGKSCRAASLWGSLVSSVVAGTGEAASRR